MLVPVEALDEVALGVLVFVAIVIFYGIIVIHDIPYEMAKHRNHPHQDAIHVAGWVSLLTLHVLWPFLWIWATLYREDRGWGFMSHIKDSHQLPFSAGGVNLASEAEVQALKSELEEMKARLEKLEQSQPQQSGQ